MIPSHSKLWWRKSTGDHRCSISRVCGSCLYINQKVEDSVKRKVEIASQYFSEEFHDWILDPVFSPQSYEYRYSAKLAVREDPVEFGLFKPGSHEMISIPDCPVQHPMINAVLNSLKILLRDSELKSYSEQDQKGCLRYMGVRMSKNLQQIMLTFVVTEESCKEQLENIIEKLILEHPHVVSVYMNINNKSGNVVYTDEYIHVFGSKRLKDSINDFYFELSPGVFTQVNPWTASVIYRKLEDLASRLKSSRGSAVAWDLCSGVGQISLSLARQGFRTLAIEENEAAYKDACYAAKINALEKVVQFVPGRMEDVLTSEVDSWASRPDLVCVNPPRTGIAPSFMPTFLKLIQDAPFLIYMSCEAKTLARDLDYLVQNGEFKLRHLEPYDMFPFTEKLEWLCLLERSR